MQKDVHGTKAHQHKLITNSNMCVIKNHLEKQLEHRQSLYKVSVVLYNHK